MTSDQEIRASIPLISVWLRPRDTIDGIVAAPSRSHIWLLASLGGLSSIASYLIDRGVDVELSDWRVFIVSLLLGAIAGVSNVYIAAFVASWLGRRIGSSASAANLRAALAWGMTPSILGLVLVLALVAGWRIFGPDVAAPTLSVLLRLVLGTCALWSIIVTLRMLSRVQALTWWRTLWVYVVAALLLPAIVALLIRVLLFQPFSIPSASMAPTLLTGDQVFVAKYSYGYGQYSLPFAPAAFAGRVFAADPQPGDLVAFAVLRQVTNSFIKRVVAVAGDRVQMKGGLLHLNGTPVKRERLPDVSGNEPCGPQTATVKRWRETLPNGVSYETLDCIDNGLYDNTSEYRVPPETVFVLGDNRDNSTDSRALSAMGYIPLPHVFGRVGMIFLSRADKPDGHAPVRLERIGTVPH